MAIVQFSSVIPFGRVELFDFLFRDEAWERGIPPEYYCELAESGPFHEKTNLKWRLTRYGFSFVFGLRIDRIQASELVVVSQSLGPFDEWILTQKLSDHGDSGTKLTDQLEYRLPLGVVGCLFDDLFLRKEVSKLLESRHEKISQLVKALKSPADKTL